MTALGACEFCGGQRGPTCYSKQNGVSRKACKACQIEQSRLRFKAKVMAWQQGRFARSGI